MMKLDSYSVIDANAVFIGLERVSESELSNLYSTRRMGVHRLDHNFRGANRHGFYQVLDDFSLPEAYLIQSVVQFFKDEDLRFDPLPLYNTIRSSFITCIYPKNMLLLITVVEPLKDLQLAMCTYHSLCIAK